MTEVSAVGLGRLESDADEAFGFIEPIWLIRVDSWAVNQSPQELR